MKHRLFSALMLVSLVSSMATIAFHAETALATSTYGRSIIVFDDANRINATLGAKSGSQITVKGTVTNLDTVQWTGLLTGIFFRENAPGLVLGDLTCEWSMDGLTWWPTGALKVADPVSACQLELVLGGGGYGLLPSQSSTTYVRVTANKDVGISTGVLSQSVAVCVWQDHGAVGHWDSPADWGWVLSQPPAYAGYTDWDNPMKIELEVVHTAEIDGEGKFCYDIQDAVDAAISGDTIWAYTGTYRESLYIDKSLTLTAIGDCTVEAPDAVPLRTFTGPSGTQTTRPIILAYGSIDVTIDEFTIDGRGVGNANFGLMGVQYFEASGTIANNTIKTVRSTPLDGAQHGVGIVVNHLWDQYCAHSVEIIRNNIFDYQKGGIVCNEPGTTASVESNTVIGYGSTDLIAQNGIQFGWNATGVIKFNEVSGHVYTLYPTWSSAGILLYQYSDGTDILENDIHDNQIGVDIYESSNVVVTNNSIYDNIEYGVQNTPSPVVDARNNWWGSAKGPYHPTLNPEGQGDQVSDDVTFVPWLPEMHDVAVIDVSATPLTVTAGDTVIISVKVENQGTDSETFEVRVYYDSTEIGHKTASDLRPNGNTTLTFNWNTAGMPMGTYDIKAKADAVPEETDASDNELEDGTVTILWHDVAVIEVVPNRAWVYQGHKVTANVSVLNHGNFSETIKVRLYYNGTNFIENALATVNLDAGESIQLLFNWTTNSSVPYCQNYTLTAVATIAADNHLADNEQESVGTVKVRVLGDVNGDDYVGIDDILEAAQHFGTRPDHENWNPDFDLGLPEPDDYIGIDDMFLIARNFGQGIPPPEK